MRLDGAPVDPGALSAMGRLTAHRGPDDEGAHVDGPCAIGMRRLSIIDLAGGHQPLRSADGRIWLVCNGEIYNFRELRRELEGRGHSFLTHSDCEVIIPLYRELGASLVDRLNGMYGFALWDAERRRLLIGRDRLGIKPIYTWSDGRQLRVRVGSEGAVRAARRQAGARRGRVAGYLQLGYVASPRTIFRGVRKLPPATVVTVENGRIAEQRYWRIAGSIDRAPSVDDWTARIRARLEESVRMQMVSDVPIGAFLSGGIDSSAVVGLMSKYSSGPVKTYSIGFGGSDADDFYNELPYAKAVAERFGTDHHEILVKPDVVSLLAQAPVAHGRADRRHGVHHDVPRLAVRAARRDRDPVRRRRRRDPRRVPPLPRRSLPSPVRDAARLGSRPRDARRAEPACRSPLAAAQPVALREGFLAAADLPAEERYSAYLQVFPRDETCDLMLRPGAFDDAIVAAFGQADSDDALNRMLVVDAETQLPDDLLMLTDKMTMATSLECRVPLLDHELVEMTARIAGDVKVRGGELKHVLKRALADLLPPEILNRKKRGFGTPMGAWLKRDLAPVLHGLLGPEAVRARGLFRPESVQRLIGDHDANRVDGTDRLLALMNLEIWSRIYLDGREPEDVTAELQRARPGVRVAGFHGARGVKVLYVCHRFPYPPKRGGKIRPFNMIRHLSRAARGDRVLARASPQEAEEARGIAPYCKRFEIGLVDDRVQALRMVARLPTPVPSSFGYFPLDRARAHDRRPARRRRRSISSSCTARRWRLTCRGTRRRRRSSTSATWTRRSGSSTRGSSRSR